MTDYAKDHQTVTLTVDRQTIRYCQLVCGLKHVKSICEKIEKVTDVKLRSYGSPLDTGGHP